MINIAVLGYGTVGSGVVEVINTNHESINKRAGDEINIKYVLDLRDFPGDPVEKVLVHDYEVIVNDPEVDIVVEVMGGIEPAYTFVKRALQAGKSVSTSNKALVAKHGSELMEIAKEKNINFLFEASCGGGIPIIRALNSSLTADEIDEITGILNGTTNYMLYKMSTENCDFDTVLKEAQAKGYAEADPTADVGGADACRKIAILSSLAYGKFLNYEDIYTEGITKITPADMEYAKELGMTIKLLATSRRIGDSFYAMVAPFLVGQSSPLYSVNDVFNAVFVHGNVLGDAMFYGSGAGKLPTASAVVADVVDEAKHLHRNIMTNWSSYAGGTSVANKERIFNVARRCIEDYKKGNDVVIVLSAMGKYTDELITMAKDINDKPPKREMDMLFTIGEQMSVALMSMAMDSLGVPAVSLNAFQVAMHTTSAHGSARLKKIEAARIRRELDNRRIVVVTGFQGIDKYNDYTTLGRGGSDTTAVALAAALHADACEIYTDVDGVYTADPRKVPNARKLKEITYDEMLDLATLGAGVLHNRSVEMAKKYGVPLVVRSSLNNSEGTVVKEEVTVERMLISGVALDTDAVRIAVIGLKDSPGVAFKLFDTLAKKNINVDMILQSIGRAGTKDISFTVDKNDLDDAMGVLEANQARIAYSELHAEKNIAKLSIVGAGMMSNPGVAAKMFESLYNEGVNINMIATSEIRVTVLINEKDGVRAMNAVHDAFNLAD